ncbi:OmpA family protein [Chondrinema litorale]|uniref:OmpA family protein n=1 Tax=Chondrinema litorale TaxID=2994555 RepID=UPI00254284F9|nr:OmpA family protein [Chondrinema litorale]UZR99997.1 OmpA family protein [Chondrinema litorale]
MLHSPLKNITDFKVFLLTTFLCLVVNTISLAQNLISNGKFKQQYESDNGMVAKGWKRVGPELGINHANLIVSPNIVGHMEFNDTTYECGPLWGRVYKGTHTSHYIAQKLAQPLQKGYIYKVKFNILLGKNSSCYIQGIGACFSSEPLEYQNINGRGDRIYYPHPQVMSDTLLKDTENWMEVTGEFIAKGGDQYIYIGGFGDKHQIHVEDSISYKYSGAINRRDYAYSAVKLFYFYAIDNVIVELVRAADDAELLTTINEGESLIFKDILFNNNSTELQAISYNTLNKLVTMLQQEPSIHIGIVGHTDNVGDSTENLVLSQNRALSVVEYLKGKGINEQRLKAKGFGENKPIASNQTEEGKSKNRRVEVMLLKK